MAWAFQVNYIVLPDQEVKNYRDLALVVIDPVICAKAAKYQIKGYDPDDLAQELRIHLLRKVVQYDPNKAGFKTWANKVLNNRLRDLNRGARTKMLNDCLSLDELEHPDF